MPPSRTSSYRPSRASSTFRQRCRRPGRAPNLGSPSLRDVMSGQTPVPAVIQSVPSSLPSLSSMPSPNAGLGILEDGFDKEDEASDTNKVVMALEMRSNGAVGCAFYVAASETLYLQEDTRITGFELVESLLLQAQPAVVIIPSRSPESFVNYLERQSRRNDADAFEQDGGDGFTVRTTLSCNFNCECGKERLAQLRTLQIREPYVAQFATATDDYSPQDRGNGHESEGQIYRRNGLMRLGTSINLDSRITLGCANALLCDLEQSQDADAEENHSFTRIRSVQTISYQNCMFVTADTMLALQIFRMDGRSNVQRPISDRRANARDGKQRAVFDLFRAFISTPQGHARLREVFLRPSTDLDVIGGRHEAISVLLHADNAAIMSSIRAALRKVKSIHSPFDRLRKGVLQTGSRVSTKQCAWSSLGAFCKYSTILAHLLRQLPYRGYGLVAEIISDVIREDISTLGARVERTIDFEKSRLTGCTVVAEGVSRELDGFRKSHDSLHSRLNNTCDGYRSLLPVEVPDPIIGCIFHPHMGYLTVTTSDPRSSEEARTGHSFSSRDCFNTWEESLREDGLIYFKSPEMYSLDAQFGDLAGQIIELEAGILHSLRLEFLGHEDVLFHASEAIGELDCLMALAAGAEKFGLSRPQMTAENILEVQGGRHMLQELSIGTFVPNDCRLAGGLGPEDDGDAEEHDPFGRQSPVQNRPSAIVLTGPNQSGKSVYIKQVAIIVYLAHAGSFVPATSAVIGITDRILSRIATRESVSRGESAFGVDLRQAAFTINFSKRRSLVLIDEFGKGTNEIDGAALFHALIDHFLGLGSRIAPKVLAATHFHEIFEIGAFQQRPGLQLAHMSVSIDAEASHSEDKVKFLYELRPGLSTESFGCHCAAINGVDAAVVERARRIAESLAHDGRLEKLCLELPAAEIGRLQDNEGRARVFLSEMEDEGSVRQKWPSPRNLLVHVLVDQI